MKIKITRKDIRAPLINEEKIQAFKAGDKYYLNIESIPKDQEPITPIYIFI